MYNEKTLTCRDCGNSFAFTASEQTFFAEKGSPMNPAAAPAADHHTATQGIIREVPAAGTTRIARCMTLFAPNVERIHRFLFCRATIAPFTALTASKVTTRATDN